MTDEENHEAADRGSRGQIEKLREINARPETSASDRLANERRIREHQEAIRERAETEADENEP